MRCSIIIRCYNEEAHIGRLLEGIMQQTEQDIEIIVVDSGSTDRTLEIAQQYPVKLVHITKDEFSFGRSLNLGCAEACGEFLLFASAHVYPVYKDWVAQILKPFSDSNIALAYGKQRGNQITQYAEHRVFARWFPEETDLRQTQPFCNNANAAIRRDLWREFPYDESLTGLEDLHWARRIMGQGYYLAYVAEAEIIHVHDERPRQTYNRYRREAIAFKRIYPEAKFSFLDFMRLWTFNVINDWYHAFQDDVLWDNVVSIPRFRLMQFWGTYQGYSQHRPVTQQLKRTFYYPEVKRPNSDPTDERDKLRVEYDPAD